MRAPAALLVAAAACGGDGGDATPFEPGPSVVVAVTVELANDVPTFKVDGRLGLSIERLPPFAGAISLADVTLPAGEREATAGIGMPLVAGRLVVRERTFSPVAPFLCGEAAVDPRVDVAVRVRLDLCFP